MYAGVSQASRFVERLEARDELFKFQTRVEMIPQEKVAGEGDIEKLTALMQAEADVPPPEPSNEQFRFTASPSPDQHAPSLKGMHADLVTMAQELTSLTQELAERATSRWTECECSSPQETNYAGDRTHGCL